MTDKEIEAMTLLEMRQLERKLYAARLKRTYALWIEANGPIVAKPTVGEFVKFRDEQESLGR